MPFLAKQGRPIGERRRQLSNWERYRDDRSPAERGYGTAWKKLRAFVLQREPLCRACNEQGFVKGATTVDHIKPKRHGGTDDLENLQPLCDECHKTKTAKEHSAEQPRFVITGPPLCGKSTWVRERARPGDLVWDFDDIASVMANCGQEIPREHRGKSPWPVMKALLVMRDALTNWLASNRNLSAGVYVIVTDIAEAHRIAFRIRGEVIDLRVGESESVK
jgi:5-methylcytosine-specific restriction enzyme A